MISSFFLNQIILLNILSCDCEDENGCDKIGCDADRISSGLGEYFCASRTKRLKT